MKPYVNKHSVTWESEPDEDDAALRTPFLTVYRVDFFPNDVFVEGYDVVSFTKDEFREALLQLMVFLDSDTAEEGTE